MRIPAPWHKRWHGRVHPWCDVREFDWCRRVVQASQVEIPLQIGPDDGFAFSLELDQPECLIRDDGVVGRAAHLVVAACRELELVDEDEPFVVPTVGKGIACSRCRNS